MTWEHLCSGPHGYVPALGMPQRVLAISRVPKANGQSMGRQSQRVVVGARDCSAQGCEGLAALSIPSAPGSPTGSRTRVLGHRRPRPGCAG